MAAGVRPDEGGKFDPQVMTAYPCERICILLMFQVFGAASDSSVELVR